MLLLWLYSCYFSNYVYFCISFVIVHFSFPVSSWNYVSGNRKHYFKSRRRERVCTFHKKNLYRFVKLTFNYDHRFSVVRAYCGHGIGTLFHTAPSVPHYRRNKAVGIMKPGHVFTIEPMINLGENQPFNIN